MKLSIRSAVVTLLLAVGGGILGVWVGGQIFAHKATGDSSLHDLVHQELTLTPEQNRQLHAIEEAFAGRRAMLEDEMRKANQELAEAIRGSEMAGSEVEAAVHHFHDAMGRLQSETIEHVFAMRGVLTPEQRTRFDDKVAQALTSNPK